MKQDRCPTCHRLKKRSNPSNARYWLLLHLISDGVRPKGEDGEPRSYSPEAFHAYFKLRYIGADEMKLPNGKTINVPKSSAELDTEEFATYMAQVEQWGIEHDIYMQDIQV